MSLFSHYSTLSSSLSETEEQESDTTNRSQFRFGDKIAQGRESIIVLAINKHTGQHHVIKVSLKNEKSLKEVNIFEKLSQDPINEKYFPKYFGFFETKNTHHIVLEKMDTNLGVFFWHSEQRKETRPYSPHRTLSILYKICICLQKFHSLGYAHLNMTLENVLIEILREPEEEYIPSSEAFQNCECRTCKHMKVKIGSFKFAFCGGKVPTYLSSQVKLQFRAPELFSDTLVSRMTTEDMQKADVWALGISMAYLISSHFPSLPRIDKVREQLQDQEGAVRSKGIPLTRSMSEGSLDQKSIEFPTHTKGKWNSQTGWKLYLPPLPENVEDLFFGMLDHNPETRLTVDQILSHPALASPPLPTVDDFPSSRRNKSPFRRNRSGSASSSHHTTLSPRSTTKDRDHSPPSPRIIHSIASAFTNLKVLTPLPQELSPRKKKITTEEQNLI